MRLALNLFLIAAVAALGMALQQQTSALREAQSQVDQAKAGRIEIGFAQSMSLHHQQAILMAKLMLDGRPTPLAGLATAIADAQLVELGEMRGMLRLWHQPWAQSAPSMDWLLLSSTPPDDELRQYLLDCAAASSGMVGLATGEQLAALRNAQGIERDQQFLSLMLAHHQGGIPMAAFAAKESQLEPVRRLARSIVADQTKESGRMHLMLSAYLNASNEKRLPVATPTP